MSLPQELPVLDINRGFSGALSTCMHDQHYLHNQYARRLSRLASSLGRVQPRKLRPTQCTYLADGTSHSSGLGHTSLYRCGRHNALASQQPIERGVQCDDCQSLRIQLEQVWPVLVSTQCHILRLLNDLQSACGRSEGRYHTLCWKHSTRCQTFE